ncbi:hypothetical protein MNVI_10780 [Mycobacterium noviomagense]|uniref:Uncharacterized protein n=1 Tax=Mycobacterium noviomagense TaxID=459858 RepID=A0A7I7PAY7_9MYCO|nr:hypothetical protein MNVI_10780 [Mycobacterium noviomagense]
MPRGIRNANQDGTDCGNGRVDIDSRTTGTGAVAAIAVAAAAPVEKPHRIPIHNRGGDNPIREPVCSTSSALPPACTGTRHRGGIRGTTKLEPTSTAASDSARNRSNMLSRINSRTRQRLPIA